MKTLSVHNAPPALKGGFKKSKTLLSFGVPATVFLFGALPHSLSLAPTSQLHTPHQHPLSSTQFLQAGIFGNIISGITSIAKAVVDVVGQVTGVTKTLENVKNATNTEASAGQKVAALGSIGGGVALIALLFFFLL